ncbi:MAG TPA: CBS domain-containing protein [Ghiorsea sp.]|nr:CBS domain-containing protein [Ghiorsea sp.]HIP06948.1 CBS domain-containing protein [Mariprofundaceae bacterium]
MSNIKEHLRTKLLHWLRPGESEEELLHIVQNAPFIRSDEQRRMLVQAVEFHDTRVREIMTPRSHVTCIDINISDAELEKEILNATVTRLPVVDGDLDHIIGVVHLWDLFAKRIKNETIILQDMLRPCQTISELQRVSGLLSEMKEGSHIAIVQDEFGGTAGIVTLSDLLEEIVGLIAEDHSEEASEIKQTEDGKFDVVARAHIEELAEAMGKDLPEGSFDTVAGLITHELGRIPLAGERVSVAGLDMLIVEADPRRIIRVLITP